MGDAFIVRRGGGGGIKDAFAVISVTYPVGSHCDCTNGTKTLTAVGTGGKYIFLIPEAGTWTVRCWDGSTYESSEHKSTKSVTIITQYQIENVTLTYAFDIYNAGVYGVSMVNQSAVSGIPIGSHTDSATYFTIATNATDYFGRSIIRRTANKIDISEYSILKVNAVLLDSGARQAKAGLYSADPAASHVVREVSIGTTEQTYSIDISGDSSPQYIGVLVESQNANKRIKVSRIWLE